MRRPAVLLLILLVPVLAARAEETPKPGPAPPEVVTPEEAAADVVAALDDEKALAALAARDDPDPWLVADVLEAGGHHEAALQFANAGDGAAIERLGAYLERSASHRGIEDARSVLERAEAAGARGAQAALDALGRFRPHRAHVPGVRLASLRGASLRKLRRYPEAADAFERAAERAEVIGWRVEIAESLYRAGGMRWRGSAYKEALALFERRLAVETALGSGIGQGRAHFGIALAHNTLGHIDDERRHRDRARALAEEHGDIEYLAKALQSDGRVAFHGGDAVRALELFDKGESLIETLDPHTMPARFRPDPVTFARGRTDRLSNSASMAMAIGEVVRARAYARKAVEMANSVEDPDVLAQTSAFLAVLEGVVHERAGRSLEALSQFDRARGRYKRLGLRGAYASVLRRVAGLRNGLGDRPAAVKAIEEALVILKETGDVREACEAHLEAGGICRSLGRGQDAVAHFEEALRFAKKLRDAKLEMDALSSLARVHEGRAEYGDAIDLLNDALRIHEARPKRGDPGNLYVQLGGIYRALGDHERAHGYIAQAIRMYEARGSPLALTNVRLEKAHLLREEGRYKEALVILEDLTRIYEAESDRSGAAVAMWYRAGVLLRHGRRAEWKEAARLLTKVVGLRVASRDRANEIHARIQLARAQVWTDEQDAAMEEAAYAFELAEETGQLTLRAHALAGLAQVHVLRREYGPAMERAEEGAVMISDYGLDLAEDERAAVRGVFERVHMWGLTGAVAGKDVAAAYRFLERGRAGGLVASLGGRQALREATVPVSLRNAEEAANGEAAMAYERYQAARQSGALRVTAKRKQELEQARRRQLDAVAAIQRATRAKADLTYAKPADLADLQASLREEDAVVMYGALAWRRDVALVITHDAARIALLPHKEYADEAIEALVSGRGNDEAVARVRKRLIEPLELKESTRRLLISPFGRLAYVPFSLLAPDREVCFAPSATTLALLRTTKVVAEESVVLALGDPQYGKQASVSHSQAAATRGRDLSPLPATRAEVTAIGDVVLLGKDASETRFRAVLKTKKHWRAVHLACHGLVDHKVPARSALVLTSDAKNDGFLQAAELFAQVPVPADLVVLSACETALGRVYTGEGLVGLTRAFMLAGTPRVIASLWKVDDEATQALMLKFYELWNPEPVEGAVRKGLGAAAALKQAQVFVRSQPKWKAPRFWAAWVLWGLPD